MNAPATIPAPSDPWRTVALREVAHIQTGLAKGKFADGAGGPSVSTPYLRVANVRAGSIDLTDLRSLSLPSAALDRYRIHAGDVLLTEGGNADQLGRGAVWEGQLESCVHQNHLFVVRPDQTRLDQRFFAYQTQSQRGRAYFKSCSKQSTNLASLSLRHLREFPTLLPPLAEQRCIADILQTWDQALALLERIQRMQESLLNQMRQRLISGQTRLHGQTAPWRQVRLRQLLVPRELWVAKPRKPFLSAGVRSHGRGIFLKPDFEPSQISLEELHSLRAGDLVLNTTFAWEGAAAIVPVKADGALVSHRFPSFAFNEDWVDPAYFAQYMMTREFVFHCGLASPGGAGRNRMLSKKGFLDISLSLPEKAEQREISQCLQHLADEQRLVLEQRRQYEDQRSGLMQGLLTQQMQPLCCMPERRAGLAGKGGGGAGPHVD
jgi:type I restriction enzyme, S subunit